MVPPDEETTPPDKTTGNPGGNDATTPPKHKRSGRKRRHDHVPKEPKHVPGHGVKGRNTHGHPTHVGRSTHKKPSTKGHHSHRAIPTGGPPARAEAARVNDVIGAKTAHRNLRQQTMPVNRDMKKIEEETKKGKKPPEKRVAKRSSRFRAE